MPRTGAGAPTKGRSERRKMPGGRDGDDGAKMGRPRQTGVFWMSERASARDDLRFAQHGASKHTDINRPMPAAREISSYTVHTSSTLGAASLPLLHRLLGRGGLFVYAIGLSATLKTDAAATVPHRENPVPTPNRQHVVVCPSLRRYGGHELL
ncbi:hypothetical protein BDU57DRAFT_158410 [Ampelomyces quisqualis]|uniref:Uncharacterized protein n=1 Tax=Ampelomyces quisqualis TaxID=50730 RepID=A0A6A5QQY9_AMPQU|nr:hypothetical protein BDU57DRAFT_158410 [Ampelomyces quisqualis]